MRGLLTTMMSWAPAPRSLFLHRDNLNPSTAQVSSRISFQTTRWHPEHLLELQEDIFFGIGDSLLAHEWCATVFALLRVRHLNRLESRLNGALLCTAVQWTSRRTYPFDLQRFETLHKRGWISSTGSKASIITFACIRR